MTLLTPIDAVAQQDAVKAINLHKQYHGGKRQAIDIGANIGNYSKQFIKYFDSVIAFEPNNINVWPNPYFGYNPEERDPLDQQVRFTHLPTDGSESHIRIFDLAGQPVKTIHHNGTSQYATWDLTNNYDIPIASGMYLAVVETSEGNKVLKLSLIHI